ncbi:prefoldin subunit alpha [Candidatus Pacearchaeota archaeon]|nr:prefoldin subunit alpha [Candidatus Pacearchaeota archaeon]|tara:strand:- start:182 stop:604 length:423 start_codon:yes stop_codon:yes gene_type:complete
MENQQETMFKLSMFEQQMQQIQQQIRAVEQAINEMTNLNFGLDELVGKKGKEIMAPIGRGIFTKAKLISEDLVVDIGGKNFVTKNIAQTKELVDSQIKKLLEAQKDLEKNLEKIGGEFREIVEKAQEEQQKEKGRKEKNN